MKNEGPGFFISNEIMKVGKDFFLVDKPD